MSAIINNVHQNVCSALLTVLVCCATLSLALRAFIFFSDEEDRCRGSAEN